MTKIPRRDVLKAAGIGTLGLGIFQGGMLAANAQVQPGMADMMAYYRFNLGDFEAAVINDSTLGINANFYSGASEEDILGFFQSLGITGDDGALANIVQILVVNTGDNLVIFDTGFGPGADQGGRLVPTLEAMGMSAADVTAVVISHFHPDHISGMSRDGGPVFPNATYYWPQPEKDFMDAQGDDSPAAGLVTAANAQIEAVGEMIAYYNDGDEIVPGVTAMAAHGHTPGHMAFSIESNGVRLVNAVDSIINVHAGTMHPDWVIRFDSIPDMAIENRKRILSMVSESRTLLFGYHFPFPGIGYAASTGEDTWMWVPAAY